MKKMKAKITEDYRVFWHMAIVITFGADRFPALMITLSNAKSTIPELSSKLPLPVL